MKKFINKLYEYYKTHSNIPEVSIDDSSGNPILDNVYAKAVCYEFGNVVVPTRMSELEDLANSDAASDDMKYSLSPMPTTRGLL